MPLGRSGQKRMAMVKEEVMRTFGKLALAAFASAVMLNCGHGNAARTVDGMPAATDAVTVSVQNNNWQDVDVYALRNGQRVRLGNVTATRTGVFVLPPSVSVAPDLRIQIHPLAANRDFVSQKLIVNPGDVVEVVVVNALPQSTVVIR